MLNDNGLTDKGLSYILEGLHHQKSLESLNICNNDFGAHSQLWFEEIFEKSHMQELRLSKIKFVNGKALVTMMKTIADSSHLGLLALKINDVNL